MDDTMKIKETQIEDEYSLKLPFKDFQETDQYKQLVVESKEQFPHLDEITIVMHIGLWYCKDVLGLNIPEPVLPPKQTEFDTKQFDVYDPEEHFKKFGDVFKTTEPPINLIDEPEVSIEPEDLKVDSSCISTMKKMGF